MERKSWKLWVLVILAVVMVCAIGMAEAKGGRTLRTKMPRPVLRRGQADFVDPDTQGSPVTQGVTCEEYSWSAKRGFVEAGYYYVFSIAVDDGSYEDGSYDIMYESAMVEGSQLTSPHFSYTFYEPGDYCLWAEKYEEDALEPGVYENIDTLTLTINIGPGSGENALMNAVSEAASECLRDTDFLTVEAINNYICENVEYDYSYQRHSAESALLEGTGVCSSYSRAFKLIADACGLQCRRVTGTAGGRRARLECCHDGWKMVPDGPDMERHR